MKYIIFYLTLFYLSSCNANSINSSKPAMNMNNKTSQMLDGKRFTSLLVTTAGAEKTDKYYYYAWCRYTNRIYPDIYLRFKNGLCFSGIDTSENQYERSFHGSGIENTIRLPRASSSEMETLRKDLINSDFSSIGVVPRDKINSKEGTWSALFCYEDPSRPKQRAQCMEAGGNLTHPKTDMVLNLLKRFAQGNSMDPR